MCNDWHRSDHDGSIVDEMSMSVGLDAECVRRIQTGFGAASLTHFDASDQLAQTHEEQTTVDDLTKHVVYVNARLGSALTAAALGLVEFALAAA
jgi:hypothetical protein